MLRVCPNAQPSLGPFLFRARSKVTQHKKRKKTENPEKTQPWCCVSDGRPSLTPIGHHVPEMSRAVGQSAEMWGSVFGKGGSCWAVGAAETLRDGGGGRGGGSGPSGTSWASRAAVHRHSSVQLRGSRRLLGFRAMCGQVPLNGLSALVVL